VIITLLAGVHLAVAAEQIDDADTAGGRTLPARDALAVDVAAVGAVVRAVVALLAQGRRDDAVAAKRIPGTGLPGARAAPTRDGLAGVRTALLAVVQAFAGAVFTEVTALSAFDLTVAALGGVGWILFAILTGVGTLPTLFDLTLGVAAVEGLGVGIVTGLGRVDLTVAAIGSVIDTGCAGFTRYAAGIALPLGSI